MEKLTRPSAKRCLRCTLVSTVFLTLSLALLMLFLLDVELETDDIQNQTLFSDEQIDEKGDTGGQWMEVLSWEPRVFISHNFLSEKECEHLIELAKPRLQQSMVADINTGRATQSRKRTSTGMFLRRGHDDIVQAIEKRIEKFTFIPVENGEGLQVLLYEVGQKYDPHFDCYKGVQRIATVLMYLSDVEEGGETVFPLAKVTAGSKPHYSGLSKCGKQGLSVKPKKGDALLFWSLTPNGTEDRASLHGGCPVIKGTKWSSTKWLRPNEYHT